MDHTEPPARRPAAELTRGLQRLESVSWRSVVQVGLLLLAVSVLVDAVAGLDPAELADELAGATWWVVAAASVVAQLPRLTQTVSALGAAPGPVPARPLYLLQLAQGYVGLAVPSSAARIAMNVRFFQRQGFTSGTALAIGGLDSFAGFLVEAALLVGLVLVRPPGLDLDLDAPSLPEWGTVLAVLVGLTAVVAAVSVLLPDRRRQFATWARNLVADGRSALAGLRSPRRLALLLGGNLGSILLFAVTLGLFVRAFGFQVPLPDLVVITVAVSLLAGLLPVPGGIGVVEGGLTLGLVAAGLPDGAAFTAVVLYRLATFYVPPLWGYAAFRRLERTGHL